ncbi:MAG TPA: hypothetical protein VHP62_01740 [Usitatibacter sp.]|nr:hypothetical protein [Usitatibacter sp.]
MAAEKLYQDQRKTFEDRLQQRDQFGAKLGEEKRQFDTGMGFKQQEAGRDQGNFEQKLQTDIAQFQQGMGLKQAEFGETKRSNLADEALKGRQIDATLQGKMMKPATPAERQSLAFYNRAQDAVKTLTEAPGGKPSLEMQIAKQSTAGQLRGQYAPNMLQTGEQQAYRQAQRAFTEARLRKESGAAIPPQEFENDARMYFAQPGDTPQTIAQKQKARETLLAGMKFASGKAFGEFYGDEGGGSPAPAAAPPPPGAPATKPSGIKSITLVTP